MICEIRVFLNFVYPERERALFFTMNCTGCTNFTNLYFLSQAEFTVHVFSAEAAEPLNMVGMGESPCYGVMLLFDCGRSRTLVMR